jgi:hypothetical protein
VAIAITNKKQINTRVSELNAEKTQPANDTANMGSGNKEKRRGECDLPAAIGTAQTTDAKDTTKNNKKVNGRMGKRTSLQMKQQTKKKTKQSKENRDYLVCAKRTTHQEAKKKIKRDPGQCNRTKKKM